MSINRKLETNPKKKDLQRPEDYASILKKKNGLFS
jgi:hypothetical protein